MKRILYIEDNAFTQRVMSEHLATLEKIAIASNLAEGRKLIKAVFVR